MPLALILLLIPLAGLIALALWARHMHERHGFWVLMWRWHAGQSLDGANRTNATWLHRSSDVLHHTGHAIWWHHLPRLARAGIRCGTELACLAALAGLALDFAVTVRVLACLAAAGLAYGAYRLARGIRGWHFYFRWVWPLKRTLALWFGVPPKLKIAADRSSIRVSLPASWAHTQREQDKLLSIIQSRTGIEIDPASPDDVAWNTRRRVPYVKLTAASPPPARVLLSDRRVLSAIEAAGPADIMAGLGCRSKEVIRNVAGEAPMVAISMPTGEGKSATSGNICAQRSRQGSILAIADWKRTSHLWARGLPNVAYASKIDQIHKLLIWLAKEAERRYDLVEGSIDIDGQVHADVGDPVTFLIEELNATQKKLKAFWRECRAADKSLPAQSPAVDALDLLLFVSRGALFTGVLIAQRLSAAATSGAGGNADARENLTHRWMWDPGAATWRMLGNDGPPPVPRGIKGRHYLVSPSATTEVQSVFGTDRELRVLALSGTVAEPPPDMPYVTRDGGYERDEYAGWTWRASAARVPELVAAGGPRTWRNQGASRPEQGFVPGPDLIEDEIRAGMADERVTLKEARDCGLGRGLSLDAMRRRSTRDPDHPRAAGRRGKENEYDLLELAGYYKKARAA